MNTCNDGTQSPSWCPATVDDVMPSVTGLLPQGPAWDAVHRPGTTINQYWRAYASPLLHAHQRICAMVDEFFCATVVESSEQWAAEYAIGGECDPWANNLCAKVSAVGGATCDYFVSMSLNSGWVITCEDIPNDIANCGCIAPGFIGLGVTPKIKAGGSNLNIGELCDCDYGPAVKHPETIYWQTGQEKAKCKVPGSSLGVSAMGPGCCNFTGYYEMPESTAPLRSNNVCVENSFVYAVDCPRADVPRLNAVTCSDDGQFEPYTNHAHFWKITVDLPASVNELKNSDIWRNVTFSAPGFTSSGCLACGQGPTFAPVLCFLEDLKPAHTTIRYEVIQ